MQLPRATRVVVSIAGEQHWLWRAVDQNGFVLDVLVQRRRDAQAARRLMKRLLKSANTPQRVMITDKRSALRRDGSRCSIGWATQSSDRSPARGLTDQRFPFP